MQFRLTIINGLMKLNKILFQRSHRYFILFFLFVIAAFAPGYIYLTVHGEFVFKGVHFHAITMTLWCLLMIAQPLLIKFKKRELHALLGKFSFGLVPLMILGSLWFAHFAANRSEQLSNLQLVYGMLPFAISFFFLIVYGLAIYYRKDPTKHARYMASTMLFFVVPITDRLTGMLLHFLATEEFTNAFYDSLPTVMGETFMAVVGFAMATIIVLILLYKDWTSSGRWKEFTTVFVLLNIFHASMMTLPALSVWQNFLYWFRELPMP